MGTLKKEHPVSLARRGASFSLRNTWRNFVEPSLSVSLIRFSALQAGMYKENMPRRRPGK
jgi:hypothetical protein